MPAVKKLHQESENVTKREWIRGHYFGALALLLEVGSSQVAVPITLELQDGIKVTENDETTLVDKMSSLCLKLINAGGYIILDSYYASKNLITDFRKSNLHLITRVRISTVGKCSLMPSPLKRGRPRIWGESVKLLTCLMNKRDSQQKLYRCMAKWSNSSTAPSIYIGIALRI